MSESDRAVRSEPSVPLGETKLTAPPPSAANRPLDATLEPTDSQVAGSLRRDSTLLPPLSGEFPVHAGRCRIEGEIARGGMGVVLRASDPVFGRELAVKVLKVRADERPDLVARFFLEARLSGRLQHPGIPPVHELGTLDDGRPYFTMKLIGGRTLEKLLQERADPSAALPRFVAVFAQICQTLGYAHSQGVIHRDLKPLNVMVGSFGEVQVMDWGLAKDMRSADSSEGEAVRASSESVSEGMTQEGQAMGTPAYMPPEQARGELERLDERADVFGLGAILCVFLTGHPPYRGMLGGDVLRQAQEPDLADAWQRLDGCGADAELIALARACLAPEPSHRPRDAGEVATAIARYQEGVQDRLRQVESQRAAAEVKAVEERKRRRVQLALAAVVLVVLLAATAVWVWLAQSRATARGELGSALEQARVFLGAGKLSESLAAARQAEGLLSAAGGSDELRQQVDERLYEVEFVNRLDRIRAPQNASQERLNSRANADARYAIAFRDIDIDVDALTPDEAVRRIADRTALRSYLVAALDDWVGPRRQARPDEPASWRRLLEVARKLDPNPWRDQFREASGRNDVSTLKQLAEEVVIRSQTTSALLALADQLIAAGQRRDAVGLLRKAQWAHPDDFWIAYFLGQWNGQDSDPRQMEEATRSFAIAVALRPGNADAWIGYGQMLASQGRASEAEIACRRALEINPESGPAHRALAECLGYRGDGEGKRQELKRSVALLREQVRAVPDDAEAWIMLSIGLFALEEFTEALSTGQQAARLDPRNPWALHNVGFLLRVRGKPAEALPWLEKAARLYPHFAWMQNSLGLARQDVGDVKGAEEAFRKAVEMQPWFLPAQSSLVRLLQGRSDPTRARVASRGIIRACEAVLHVYPDAYGPRSDLGYFLWKEGDLVRSVRHSRKACEVNRGNGLTYSNLGMALYEQGLLDEAVEASRQGTRQAVDERMMVFNNLAFHLMEKGASLAEAEIAVRQALALDANSDIATLTLAEVLRARGKLNESLEAYRAGHALHDKKIVKEWPTADWVKDAERLLELDRRLPAILKGEIKLATAAENLELAQLCIWKQRLASGVRFYQSAFALDPKIGLDLASRHRYQAARCAVKAGLGNGPEPSSTEERTQLRRLALDWLRADLAAWRKRVEGKPEQDRLTVRHTLQHWRSHDDLLSVREATSLVKLSESERRDWDRFWQEVNALLKTTEEKP